MSVVQEIPEMYRSPEAIELLHLIGKEMVYLVPASAGSIAEIQSLLEKNKFINKLKIQQNSHCYSLLMAAR